MEVSTRQSSLNLQVAPVTGFNKGLIRAEIKNGVREIVLCKDQDNRIGVRLRHVNNVSVLCISLLGTKEMFYLTTHSTHFIYGYMMSNIW